MTSRLRETPLSESFTSCAARFTTSSSMRSQRRSRSITQVRVVRRCGDGDVSFSRLRPVLRRGLHVLLHVLRRPADGELLEQESKLLIVGVAERNADVGWQIPELLLEWPERLLARLVKELLIGVLRFALV